MCTVFTVDAAVFAANNADMRERIWQDGLRNSDGQSLLLVKDGEVILHLRSLSGEAILYLIDMMDWDRLFLHSRLATQGAPTIPNTHGWYSAGVYYMHNGYISDDVAEQYDVDSQAIGHWLRRGGVSLALKQLEKERYANVLLIDTTDWTYVMSRSTGGFLYTDGEGNFSTNSVGPINKQVKDKSSDVFELPLDSPLPVTAASVLPAELAEEPAGSTSPNSEARDEYASLGD